MIRRQSDVNSTPLPVFVLLLLLVTQEVCLTDDLTYDRGLPIGYDINELVVRAQCEAICYSSEIQHVVQSARPNLTGPTQAKLYKCNAKSNECIVCVKATKSYPPQDCERTCPKKNGRDSCLTSCQCLSDGLRRVEELGGINRSSLPWSPTVSFACLLRPEPVIVILKFDMGYSDVAVFALAPSGAGGKSGTVPVVFLLEAREESPLSVWGENEEDDEKGWSFVAKHTQRLFNVSGLSPDSTYRFRVTAVAPDGILGQPTTSEQIQTPSARTKLMPPTEFYWDRTIVVNRQLTAILKWAPPKEKFCYYWFICKEIYGRHMNDTYIFLPDRTHRELRIPRLNFATKYEFIMVSTTDNLTEESNKTSVVHTTKSCIFFLGYNFTLCAPGAPINASVAEIEKDWQEELPTKESGETVTVEVNWDPPLFVNSENLIRGYRIHMFRYFNPDDLDFKRMYNKRQELPANQTSTIFTDVPRGLSYTVNVRAISEGGLGEAASVQLTLQDAVGSENTRQLDTTTELFVGLSCSMVGGILIISAILVYMCRRSKKKKIAADGERGRYFQALELNLGRDSDIYAKSELEAPLEEGEVDYQALRMGEILGQGCFGLVKKALMWSDQPWPHWEDVAVKTLRPDASDYDKSLLLEEIKIMKEVGYHSNIIGVLGFSTREPNICLVLEYCPLGDLQSYLRRFRDTELPGTETGSGSGTGQAIVYNNSAVDSGVGNNFPVTYNNAPQRDSRSQTSGVTVNECDETGCTCDLHTYQNDPGGSRTSDYSSLYTEDASTELPVVNDYAASDILLSYGRQIAMGMEYLSQNKLVHRDLAARNVLVHSPRVVKIADFGLTKDVYESSIYKRRTDGKLPVKWLAHESIFDQVFTSKSDVWSFGILMWEIVTLGSSPYPGIEVDQLIRLLRKGYRMTRPPNCSEFLFQMMSQCWQTNPIQRPSFTELRLNLEQMLESSQDYLSLDLEFDYQELQASVTAQERQPLSPNTDAD